MFFFFHLFTGIVLGLLIGDLLHDRRWLLPCAVGAVLPDLIDKPAGYILFADTIGNGRIFTHTMMVAGIVLITGMLFWKYRSHPAGLALFIGILSHQFLDLMWRGPVTWYYPLLGEFDYIHSSDYIFTLLEDDISIRLEWVLAGIIGVGGLLYMIYRKKKTAVLSHMAVAEGVLAAAALLFLLLSGASISFGLYPRLVSIKKITKTIYPYIGWTRPEGYIIGGIVFALSAYYVWQLRSQLKRPDPVQDDPDKIPDSGLG